MMSNINSIADISRLMLATLLIPVLSLA